MTLAGIARWRVRAGYPVAACFLALAWPTIATLAAGAAVAALGLFVRAAAAGHLHKHEQLATRGPYAFTRNPLYLGSAVLAAGFAVAGASWIAAALVAAYFAVFYPAAMRREEDELRARYGAAFEEYSRRVPRFWPRLSPSAPAPAAGTASSATDEFSWRQFGRNREYQAAIGTIIGLAVLAAKMFWLRA
jgi:hypothetical protein